MFSKRFRRIFIGSKRPLNGILLKKTIQENKGKQMNNPTDREISLEIFPRRLSELQPWWFRPSLRNDPMNFWNGSRGLPEMPPIFRVINIRKSISWHRAEKMLHKFKKPPQNQAKRKEKNHDSRRIDC